LKSLTLATVNPKKLRLVIYPHPALTTKAIEIPVINTSFADPDLIKAIADRMIVVLKSMDNGIGLAANQVGLPIQMFVALENLNYPKAESHEPIVYINPIITSVYGGMVAGEESCLSFPGVRGYIERHSALSIVYKEIDGVEKQATENGLQGICIQHEMDHLAGINLIDRFDKQTLARNASALRRFRK